MDYYSKINQGKEYHLVVFSQWDDFYLWYRYGSKLQNFEENFLVFFLIAFPFWLRKGSTTPTEIQSSSLSMMFLSVIRIENWLFLKSGKRGWQPSFCGGTTVSRLTNYLTFLIWISDVSVAKWICGGNCLLFDWFSYSSSCVKERLYISAVEKFFPFV